MELSLDRLLPGQQGVVTCIDTAAGLQNRLYSFGMIPGTRVYCRYQTPGGSVTALEFRGTVVALRTRDLQKIRVKS